MTQLSQIVDVTIDRQTRGITQIGFGTPMVLGLHTRFSERQRKYTDIDGMVSDGFLTSDTEYKAANAIFSQEQRPESILVGRRTATIAQVVTFTPDVSTQAAETFEVTLNGVLYSFLSDSTPTAAEVVTGLSALINADVNAVVTATGSSTLIVTADVAGTPFSYAGSTRMTAVATTANHGVAEDIQAVIAESDDWYMLILTSRTDADILNAADEIEGRLKMFAACSAAAGILTSGTTDVAYKLKAQTYDRTFLLYSADQATYPEAGWAGLVLPFDPGSETWKFKTITGSAASNLSATESSNAIGKNANTYETFSGRNITQNGTSASGEFVDVIRGIDWLKTRMQERIFLKLATLPKIPFTDGGVAIIENEIRAQLNQGVRVGLITSNPAYTVTVPKVADVSQANRAARLLPDVTFTANLAGAVHKVKIKGTVSV